MPVSTTNALGSPASQLPPFPVLSGPPAGRGHLSEKSSGAEVATPHSTQHCWANNARGHPGWAFQPALQKVSSSLALRRLHRILAAEAQECTIWLTVPSLIAVLALIKPPALAERKLQKGAAGDRAIPRTPIQGAQTPLNALIL